MVLAPSGGVGEGEGSGDGVGLSTEADEEALCCAHEAGTAHSATTRSAVGVVTSKET